MKDFLHFQNIFNIYRTLIMWWRQSVVSRLIFLKIYCIMQAQKSFQTATLLFYQNKLEQALLSINQSINIKPSSIAFNNRALIHFHMGRETQARDDIGMALSIDPLNYPAYLNLASIDARQLDYPSAIENLTCAISALRLILGKRTKQRSQVLASLQACHNNFDALVLVVLMDCADSNYTSALEVIVKYERYQDDKSVTKKLKEIVEKLVHNYSYECQQSLYQLLQRTEVKHDRLQCSNKAKSRYLQEETDFVLNQNMQQFNKYYQLINKSIGKTKHVPKTAQNYVLMQQPQTQQKSFLYGSAVKEMITSH